MTDRREQGLPAELCSWRERGQMLRVGEHEVFALSVGDSPETLAILHGFPSSSYDFHLALERLARRFRVVLHDHIGFGLSDKPPRYSYSLLEQADVALAVWRQLGVQRLHLLAHDYGTSVATELLARRERETLPATASLQSVTLCNGSVHIELARLRPVQRLLRAPRIGPLVARLMIEPLFVRQIRRILADPHAVAARELELMWAGIVHRDGIARAPQIARYIDERWRFWDRWIGALTRLDLPAHVLWARRDPVAVAAIGQRLASEIPGAQLSWIDDLGHYPMLEAPERWAEAVIGFYEEAEYGG